MSKRTQLSNPDRVSPFWRRTLVVRLNAYGCAIWLATAIACCGPAGWPLELTNHLHVVYLAVLVPAAAACAALRCFRFAAGHALFAGANLWVLAPAWLASAGAAADGPALELAVINVNSGNRDHARVVDLLRRERPDVALLLEVNDAWMRDLAVLGDLYPHRHAVSRPDNFGIALFSRQPLAAETRVFGPSGVPSIVATADLAGHPVVLIGTHPLPPMRGATARQRDEQLRAVADHVRARAGSTVVLGDLNTSAWAPSFRELVERANLRDGRRGRGVLATWPSFLPVMAIDHVLVSPDLVVSSLRVGPAIGSDHLPLLARVQREP